MTANQNSTQRESSKKGYELSSTNHNSFKSEKVYADGVGSFTRVSCGEVYAFSSIATSGHFSETTDTFGNVTQYGVELIFPNGRTELLVFQLGNLLSVSRENRTLIDELFDNGTVWISNFNDLFRPGMFPKTWDCLVVPTREDAEAVHSYRDNSFTKYSPEGKADLSMLAYSLSGAIVSSLIGIIYLFSSNILYVGLALLMFAVIYEAFPLAHNYVQSKTAFSNSYFWGQLMNPDSLEEVEPISDDFKERTEKVLRGFTGRWTEGTITSINESEKTTEVDVLTERGEELSFTFTTPADSSTRFVLNRLVNSLGVGSVRMLEGEKIEIGIPRLNDSDAMTTRDDSFRVRPIA